jgi:hypothetical protein
VGRQGLVQDVDDLFDTQILRRVYILGKGPPEAVEDLPPVSVASRHIVEIGLCTRGTQLSGSRGVSPTRGDHSRKCAREALLGAHLERSSEVIVYILLEIYSEKCGQNSTKAARNEGAPVLSYILAILEKRQRVG